MKSSVKLSGLLGSALLLLCFGADQVFCQKNHPQCGQKNAKPDNAPDGKIIGGEDTYPHEYPWQVSLRKPGFYQAELRHFCGASLLNSRWLITAGHCVANKFNFTGITKAVLGAWNIRKVENSVQTVALEKVVVHPNYIGHGHNHSNDIALIKLAEEVQLGESERRFAPICLPEQGEEIERFSGKKCATTGWGRISMNGNENSQYSGILQQVNLTVWKEAECEAAYNGNFPDHVDRTMLCANTYSASSCYGDSGGPFVCYDETSGRWQLEGVVSWGHPCAIAYHPSVYSRVAQFVDWIWDTVKVHSDVIEETKNFD